ncbi:MAG: indolepyruvate ferredoxin oxidoreductase subunit alpha, partial [Candidatus Thorarchaeota archaeon]
KHGAGGKWYLNARNYSEEVAKEGRVYEHLDLVYKKFEQAWSGRAKGLSIPGIGYKLRMPIIGRVIKSQMNKLLHNEGPKRSDNTVDGHFGQVLPVEEAKLILGNLAAEPMILSICPCRWTIRGKKEARCINFGPASDVIEKLPRFAPEGKNMRIDREQAIETVEQFKNEGNILSVYTHPVPNVSAICACDIKDCTGFFGRTRLGVYNLFKGEYVAKVTYDNCEGCKECIASCQLGAVHYSGARKQIVIDQSLCFGCGLCRDACEHDAVSLVPREEIPGLAGQY